MALVLALCLAPSFSAPPHPTRLPMRRRSLPIRAEAATAPAFDTGPGIVPLRWRHFGEYARGELVPSRFQCFGDACDVDTFDKGTEVYGLMDHNAAVQVSLGPVAAWNRARVAFYFGLWYALSVVYSVKNKQAHIALAMPLTIATAQLLVGAVVAGAVWTSRLRMAPRVSAAALRALLPIGFFHAAGHLTGVFATAVGSVSFVQVVKSAGPVWAALVSWGLLRQASSRAVWISLVPIVGGVGLASAQELSFAWAAFLASAASDVALALRNVLSKKSMDGPQAENMTPANTFYLFTILSCAFCLPLCAALEAPAAAAAWAAAEPPGGSTAALLALIFESGLYFTAYSEVQFKALDSVSPVTHAVGNTMRRVVIMLVCIAVFHTPVSLLGGVGSTVAIAGSYMYAMAKTREKAAADKAAAEGKEGIEASATRVNAETKAGRQQHPLLWLIGAIGRTGLCG